MTEGADDGAALPCSPWAGDAADSCQGDAVLSQALQGRNWWSLLAFWPLVEPSLCPAVAESVPLCWSDMPMLLLEWFWSIMIQMPERYKGNF